jgi:Lhr-like helicase
MLKRLFVSSSSLLKVKTYTNKRCYWIPPESQEPSKVSFVKEKYDIPKEILELIESQEKELKNIRNELTNQKKLLKKYIINLQVYKNLLTNMLPIHALYNLFL